MSINQVCVCRHTPTFSSDLDGRVFLCPPAAEKVRQLSGRLRLRLRLSIVSSLAAALLGLRRVIGRRGCLGRLWAGG